MKLINFRSVAYESLSFLINSIRCIWRGGHASHFCFVQWFFVWLNEKWRKDIIIVLLHSFFKGLFHKVSLALFLFNIPLEGNTQIHINTQIQHKPVFIFKDRFLSGTWAWEFHLHSKRTHMNIGIKTKMWKKTMFHSPQYLRCVHNLSIPLIHCLVPPTAAHWITYLIKIFSKWDLGLWLTWAALSLFQTFDECVAEGGSDCAPEKLWLQIPFFCGHSSECW